MIKKPVHEILENLPNETDSAYAFKVREIISALDDPLEEFLELITDKSLPEKTRFNAFYGALVYLWREREFKQYRQLVDDYENIFSDHVLFYTFRSQYYICLGKNEPNCKLALEYALEAKKLAPNLPNILHLFTGSVIELAEVSKRELGKQYLIDAEHSINKAIAITHGNYARYYATKANLLSKLERFNEARELIQKAIEIEPAKNSGYALRIGDYQEIRLKIAFMEYSHQIQRKQIESLDRIEEVRLRIIELLGILAAIIAFLVTSIQIGKNLAFEEAARLMIISGGVILIIFSSYSIIFFRESLRVSQVIVLLFGTGIVCTFLF